MQTTVLIEIQYKGDLSVDAQAQYSAANDNKDHDIDENICKTGSKGGRPQSTVLLQNGS